MARWKAILVVLGVAIVAVAVPVAVGAVGAMSAARGVYPERADAVSLAHTEPAHDPTKPTVAIVVGPTGANIADTLAPFEVLAGTGAFNVYTVAPTMRAITLTGGLDLVPQLDFAGLDRLLGHSPDAVIVPALPGAGGRDTAVVEQWLTRQRADGLPVVASICVGAEVLASAGILDDRPATAHWLGLIGLRRDYPDVGWRNGVRYVDDGDVITSAAVLSGVDIALRIIERTRGTAMAQAAAHRVSWPGYTAGRSARMSQSGLSPADSVALLSAAYRWDRGDVGVLLSDGVGEIELAAAFRPYTELSYLAEPLAMSAGSQAVTTRHGLTVVPRAGTDADVDRVIVPGTDAAARRIADGQIDERSVTYLNDEPGFAFDGALRDIARTYDAATARWVAKSMQYPDTGVELAGPAWPWRLTVRPLLLAVTVVVIAMLVTALVVQRRRS
ncbi:DJ-1/PfpI family protein [Gordonia sp. CPCC 206044]|uniref:DJ-1/PfpI family protein n=1 Tax=Gordonia sp. CPCC 206044 TaxID=3140793 RepID=UPI003AF397E1